MQSNEQTLKRSYDAFGRGEVNPLVEALADDIQFTVSGGSPVAGVYSGKAGVLVFFGKMGELYQGSLRLQVLDILASDSHGVVLTQESLEYRGRSVEFRSVHVWEFQNGKLHRFQTFYDDSYHRFWSNDAH